MVISSSSIEPFALDALRFFAALAEKDNFTLEATTNWEDLNDANLKSYQLVVWLNDFPHNQPEREAFEKYMTGAAPGSAFTYPHTTTRPQSGHGL